MRTLIFGASGSGKSYVSQALAGRGIPAFDADEIEGLSPWYDPSGNKVPAPGTAEEALRKQLSFLWSRKFLRRFLSQYPEMYLFGGSGNVFSLLDLFDQAYFLKIDPIIQQLRLNMLSRKNAALDHDDNETVVWGGWLEQEALRRGIAVVDGSQTPEQLFAVIRTS